MRVGIITFHQTSNYGASLQAFALWQAVSRLGHEAEIIDYVPYRTSMEYWKGVLKSRQPIARNRQYQSAKKFIIHSTKLSRKYRTPEAMTRAEHPYDMVITGSDEVWNIEKSFIGFDPCYFLKFIQDKSVRKASYAASFGSTLKLNGYGGAIQGLLDDFDFVGVRDRNSKRLVESCGKKAVKVLDPTFLGDYTAMQEPVFKGRKYLLIYAYKLKPEENRFIQRVARAKNLEIVSVGNPNPIADHSFISASPDEWVRFYRHASYVMTSYYHGTVFAVLFQKPFHVFLKPTKITKTLDLLDDFGLQDRLFKPTEPIERFMGEIDYQQVGRKIEEEKTASENYLRQMLGSQNEESCVAYGQQV